MSFRQRRVFYNSSIGTFHPSPFAIVFDTLCSRALHHSTFAKHFTTLLLPSISPLYFCPAFHHSIFAKHFTTLLLPSISPLYFCQALHHSTFAQHFTTLFLPSTSPLYFCQAVHHSTFAKHFTTLFLPSTSPLYFCQALHHSIFAKHFTTLFLPSTSPLFFLPRLSSPFINALHHVLEECITPQCICFRGRREEVLVSLDLSEGVLEEVIEGGTQHFFLVMKKIIESCRRFDGNINAFECTKTNKQTRRA